ncbi:MAG: DUF2635 domain-containing protein [Rhodospirillales bacterium]|nr:DUF2635 domain-containing protein [Rhodospirillales bacterium]
MTRIRVRPAPGRRVRLPGGKLLKAEGALVARDLFIERRLAAGDVVEVPEAPAERVRGEKR